MNDRLMMLYQQAHVVDGIMTNKLYIDKFAELIVRECAGIVDNKIEVSRYVHEAELLRECSTTIKQHFGVEE